MTASDPFERLQQHAREWRVTIENSFETETSIIAFGNRKSGPRHQVAVKIVKQPGDEWHSGEILEALAGSGVVHVYEHTPGAILLERLSPGSSLVELALNGRDEEATNILAEVMQQIFSAAPDSRATLQHCPSVYDWAKGFERYLASDDDQIPKELVNAGQSVFLSLCESQRQPRLLHGDLQHYNVLFDSARGWLAIDPKGVFSEIEYEVGAALRNPVERPELFLSRAAIERRINRFATVLSLDYERVLSWGFAQAVLSAIWEVEDGHNPGTSNPALCLAEIIREMLNT